MSRAILALAILAAALFGLRRGLEGSAGGASSGDYLRPLVSAEERARLRVAGVSISSDTEGGQALYLLSEGRWRCASAYGAVALTPQLEGLVADLTEARGELVARGERAAAYGLGPAEVQVVRLHGPGVGEDPSADVLIEFELGHSLVGLGKGRGYLRRQGSDEVLEIDADPRARLVVDEQERLPPMLDERLLAGEWPSKGEGIERAFLDFSDGRSIEVRSRVLGPAPSPGLPVPREWLAIEGERRAPVLGYRIGAWQAFLYRVPYRGLSDPRAAERRGLDEPVATVTLIQVDGEPIELVVGRSAPSGATFVLNRRTGQLCLLDKAEVQLLLASMDGLCSTELANPWEAWLPK